MKRNSCKRLCKLHLCQGENPASHGNVERSACPTSYTLQFHSARNGNAPRCPATPLQVNAKKVLGAGHLLSSLNPLRSKRLQRQLFGSGIL